MTSKLAAAAQLAPKMTEVVTNATSSWSTTKKVIVGGGIVAIGGYLLYRHFKKGK